jgi:hypothetical protein
MIIKLSLESAESNVNVKTGIDLQRQALMLGFTPLLRRKAQRRNLAVSSINWAVTRVNARSNINHTVGHDWRGVDIARHRVRPERWAGGQTTGVRILTIQRGAALVSSFEVL